MKKLKSLDESSFLKLFFAFLSAAFLIGAVCMPDRGDMFHGLGRILMNTCKVSTNYFDLGGVAATFLNMGLVALSCTLLFVVTGAKPNNVSTLATILTVGFGSWGINVLNIWPTILGVVLYGLVKREKMSSLVNAMLFSTGIAPLISDLLFRYPYAEAVGFHWAGVGIAMAVGLFIGFILPAGLAHSPIVHKGFDLYSAALPIGMTAFFLQAFLFKTMGVALPNPDSSLKVVAPTAVNVFCLALFGGSAILALLLGCTPKQYWKLLTEKKAVGSFSATYGNATFLMNFAVFGLFILGYYNLAGAIGAARGLEYSVLNGVTFGIIFCMLATCNSGSHPLNVLPILAGYLVASYVFEWLSGAAGGDFAGRVYAQPILIGLCYANGLSPVSQKYGWFAGLVLSAFHYILVTSVPALHGGFCLYNGGFTAALICLIFVPQLERFFKTREERAALKTK